MTVIIIYLFVQDDSCFVGKELMAFKMSGELIILYTMYTVSKSVSIEELGAKTA